MIEVAIKENGGQPKWISLSEFKKILRKTKSHSPCPPLLKDIKGFQEFWDLYDNKKGKSKAEIAWKRNVKSKLVPIILNHVKKYVKSTPDKQYRKHASTYLNSHSWNDEITQQEEKIDLDELYPFDTSGSSRKGRCSKCNSIVFGNKFTIHKDDSDCCKVKIKQYR